MALKPWKVVLYFAAETPDDGVELDALTDRLDDAIVDALWKIADSGIEDGSVRLSEIEIVSVEEYELA